jgi:uncharacterized RDD family membrane protein YckC
VRRTVAADGAAPRQGATRAGSSTSGAAKGAARRAAPLSRRLLARLLDTAVMAVPVAWVGAPLVQDVTAHLQDKIDAARELGGETTVWMVDPTVLGRAGLLLATLLAVGFVYEAVPTALWGRTAGKALFGLRVADTGTGRRPGFGAAVGRWLSYQLLQVVLVGVLDAVWCLVDRPRRQCWHDKAAGTWVVRGGRPAPARPKSAER